VCFPDGVGGSPSRKYGDRRRPLRVEAAVVSQSFPKVAVAPLIVIWFGLGELPKILIAFSVAFFPIVVSTISGMKSVDTDLRDLARSMQSTAFKTFTKIRLPFALPQIFSELKVAIAFSSVGAVVGEWVGADEGPGYLLLWSNAKLDTPLLFAVLVCLMLIGLVLYCFVEFLETWALPGAARQQSSAAPGGGPLSDDRRIGEGCAVHQPVESENR
jgi:NitT/TauT family transport system permease protein